jgi:DNA invertase Pin-like site-specific DNA recombinase
VAILTSPHDRASKGAFQVDSSIRQRQHLGEDVTSRRHWGRRMLMLTVLGGFAEFERELIRSRTTEGRARARAEGVVMGCKPKLTHHQRQEAIARWDTGESLVDIGRCYNVSHSTISRL